MPESTPTILLLGTCDTKLPELLHTKHAITAQDANINVLIMDIGRNITSDPEINISQSDLNPKPNPNSEDAQVQVEPQVEINTLDRDTYIKTLSTHAAKYISDLHASHRIHGILAIGGSCGTALAAAAMREGLPVGFPKLIVSTMASGDVSAYTGESDIAMMYSVVDIAGRNRVLDMVLGNAAGAIAGMGRVYFERQKLEDSEESRKTFQDGVQVPDGRMRQSNVEVQVRIGISMFGVTTPGVTAARKHFEKILPGCEVYIFHATGSGGRAMERLVSEGQLDAILDLTTTELADEIVGGVLSAGPQRLVAATKRDIPRLVSVGACDMVNFGTVDSIPERFGNVPVGDGDGNGDGANVHWHEKKGGERVFHRHNPTVTLMRTTADECREIARIIARNIQGASRTRVLLPTGGISMIDVPGQPFWNSEVDEVLFSTLEDDLRGHGIEVVRDERDINHPEFAELAAEMLRDLISQGN